ncbi:cold-shock protein [Streptomyces lavendulae]|uniref:cold-shock protein n=1 Tax=Streptomyces lavendulae TaxID=1914 RepID=UPI0036A7559D
MNGSLISVNPLATGRNQPECCALRARPGNHRRKVARVPSGVVKWFDADKGIGVICQDGDGQAVTAERSAIQAPGPGVLVQGELVRFDVTRDAEGIRADNVRRIPWW